MANKKWASSVANIECIAVLVLRLHDSLLIRGHMTPLVKGESCDSSISTKTH